MKENEKREEKVGKYTLKIPKPSEIPKRGKWKTIALDIIDKFDFMPERTICFETNSKEEYDSLYSAFKSIIKRNKLTIEVKRDKGKIFLFKDMRYFVK